MTDIEYETIARSVKDAIANDDALLNRIADKVAERVVARLTDVKGDTKKTTVLRAKGPKCHFRGKVGLYKELLKKKNVEPYDFYLVESLNRKYVFVKGSWVESDTFKRTFGFDVEG